MLQLLITLNIRYVVNHSYCFESWFSFLILVLQLSKPFVFWVEGGHSSITASKNLTAILLSLWRMWVTSQIHLKESKQASSPRSPVCGFEFSSCPGLKGPLGCMTSYLDATTRKQAVVGLKSLHLDCSNPLQLWSQAWLHAHERRCSVHSSWSMTPREEGGLAACSAYISPQNESPDSIPFQPCIIPFLEELKPS